jgi:hypothetical protein
VAEGAEAKAAGAVALDAVSAIVAAIATGAVIATGAAAGTRAPRTTIACVSCFCRIISDLL